jgi:TRAP-type C4-dicarboxylate transport system permease large subunit
MGLGVFIVTSIARDVSIVDVYRKVLPFVAVDLLRLALLTAFPAITLVVVRLLN